MSVTGQQIVDWAQQLKGADYVFGVENDGEPVDEIEAEDCSELVQNDCDANHVVPRMPDGAIYQMRHCRDHGTLISVEQAIKTPGALIFRISASLGNHVVISRGDGTTIEARGRKYGVGNWRVREVGRVWTHAALIPGVDYSEKKEA